MSTDQLNDIQTLSADRFERARTQAETQITQRAKRPDPAAYKGADFSKYPRVVNIAALIGLVIVALAAFWISAAKQIAASDLIFSPLLAHYSTRLSPLWGDMAIVFMLALGELGCLLFMTAHAILGGSRFTTIFFYGMAGLCALIALLSNISITALHPEDIGKSPVFAWFMTVAAPIYVLGIGLYAERLLLSGLEARANARQAFKADLVLWENAQRNPADHPDFNRFFALAILDQLQKVSPLNRRKIETAAQVDPRIQIALVQREMARHSWADQISVSVVPSPMEQPAMIEPVSPAGMLGNGHSVPSLEQMEQADNIPAVQLQKAREWLQADPGRADLTVREAAAQSGISATTLHRAKQTLKA